MNDFLEKDNLENKLRRVRLLWTTILFVLILLLTIIFSVYLVSLIPEPPSTPVEPGVEVATKPFPIDLAFISTIFFISGLITLVVSSGMARTYQSDQLIRPIFSNYKIIKKNRLGGIILLNHGKEVSVSWSSKGYFVLTYNDEPVAFAKSTELYWKIMYLRHKLNLKV
ncbi:MAG: hypothetical protein ACW981_11585 [Candidatus Hodarchaeales archaeon]|jgi:hypothetical protein